ncbi:MAG: 50S ribosomal protein L6 [Actinobacteria bacterium]|nr:50S ribosomal protein L6 [Actinomycetota bacterium]
MSRIGKKPVVVPDGVEIKIEKTSISVKGKLGELFQEYDEKAVKIDREEDRVIVRPLSVSKEVRSKYGLYRSLISNMVIGVSSGFSRTLKIIGVGYRVSLKGDDLEILVGYSNPVAFKKPEGINFEVPDNTTIVISGIDKQVVGETAANIRKLRPPEPYKGKGIKYADEIIRRKAGKTTASASG